MSKEDGDSVQDEQNPLILSMSRPPTSDIERAVIGFCEHESSGFVLWAFGDNLLEGIDNVGPDACDLELLDKSAPDHGIWVWEGYFEWHFVNTPDCREWDCRVCTKSWRPPTGDEWMSIQANVNPWLSQEDPLNPVDPQPEVKS